MKFSYLFASCSMAFAVGCTAADVVDELAGETPEDEAQDGKADGAVDGSYTYFEVHTDTRKCLSPHCGGDFLARVNRSSTTCVDGVAAAACYVPELDFSESGLSQENIDKLRVAAGAAAFENMARPLVRGRFAKGNSTIAPEMGRFIVTEAWMPESAVRATGVFVRIKDNGLRCIQAPCPSIGERALNTSRGADISEVDVRPSGIGEDRWGELINEMFQPHGLIIAGDRTTISVGGRSGKARTATNVFHKLVDLAPCQVTGCSGQICADQDVITTCEARKEYACYETATCERQADGQCGWTETPELQACLGH